MIRKQNNASYGSIRYFYQKVEQIIVKEIKEKF